jgi:hypothetical protein
MQQPSQMLQASSDSSRPLQGFIQAKAMLVGALKSLLQIVNRLWCDNRNGQEHLGATLSEKLWAILSLLVGVRLPWIRTAAFRLGRVHTRSFIQPIASQDNTFADVAQQGPQSGSFNGASPSMPAALAGRLLADWVKYASCQEWCSAV